MRAGRLLLALATLALLAACDHRPDPLDASPASDAGGGDAGGAMDAGGLDGSTSDSGSATSDAGSSDAGAGDAGAGDAAPSDSGALDSGPPDSGPPDSGPPDSGPPDAGTPARSDHHVHIYVSNTCAMTVSPTEITIPPGQTAYFDWHNHSADYPVNVWMSYGGGYTDLPTGATWDEPIGHCSTTYVGDEYADISTACSSIRFRIHCN